MSEDVLRGQYANMRYYVMLVCESMDGIHVPWMNSSLQSFGFSLFSTSVYPTGLFPFCSGSVE